MIPKKVTFPIPRCSNPSNSSGSEVESSDGAKTPFGYSRKDVLLIGLGVTLAGIGLKSGLEGILSPSNSYVYSLWPGLESVNWFPSKPGMLWNSSPEKGGGIACRKSAIISHRAQLDAPGELQ